VKALDTSQYLSLFLEESAENIDNLNQLLLELEKDPGNKEVINEIFRGAHTLKGMSATMGYNNIAELTHNMENMLDRIRNGSLEVTTDLITALFECMDTLEKMINGVSSGKGDDLDFSDILKRFGQVSQESSGENAALKEEKLSLNQYDLNILKEARERLYSPYRIEVVLREGCQLKAARAFLIFNNLSEFGEIVKSEPSAENIEKEEFDRNIFLIYLTQREKEFIEEVINKVSEIESFCVEEINPEEYAASESTEVLAPVEKADAKEIPEKRAPSKKLGLGQSVRVELDRLDKLMNLVGELVIHRTRLEKISSSYNLMELNETLEQVERITSDLQDLVMKVRMIPLERIFSRLPRMVRDLSKELHKDIDFKIKGQETELDRTVVDELGDSIIHILRNAVDHGIESREERIALGKDPRGKVTITAYQEGNKAVIKVEDDGHGLDTEKIRQKAISKGLNVEGLSDSDIRNFIFMEGFSTSEKVTDISGRGVGMDVVKTKITSVGGSIDVISEKGKGTSFIIRLPLTLSIIQALLVKVCSETFALALNFIEKIILISQKDIKYSNKSEVILYRDQIIPVVRVAERLKMDGSRRNEEYLVIAKVGEKKVGLMVDSLLGQQEIVIKPLGRSLKGLKEYVGATILGDGRVTLILDIASMM